MLRARRGLDCISVSQPTITVYSLHQCVYANLLIVQYPTPRTAPSSHRPSAVWRRSSCGACTPARPIAPARIAVFADRAPHVSSGRCEVPDVLPTCWTKEDITNASNLNVFVLEVEVVQDRVSEDALTRLWGTCLRQQIKIWSEINQPELSPFSTNEQTNGGWS